MFQIPAIYLAENYDLFTIIVTPLIGLMNDQVNNIQTMTTCAATINSEYTPDEKNNIKKLINEKKISILYVSPETLLSNNPISNLIGDRKIGLMIVDESHIVTTWGKSFRPDYWFLGDYIGYLRSKQDYRFPIATFSATVTYGGNDDMHGDIIDSLKMKTGEFEYIAPMRRDDISFKINHIKKINDYQSEKETIVTDSLKKLLESKRKTIVYFPYTKQVDYFIRKEKNTSMVVRYHGGLSKIEKNESAEKFKNDQCKMILATKAFGMGIDIDNVEVVYHYAPTGNLCDYVQEIGRAARNKDIQGIAMIDFFDNDYKFINQLFGMSSVKNYHLVETLKKIRDIYVVKKKRNFTVSPDDFSYIFPSSSNMNNVDNMFKMVMLMIQKDFEKNPEINFKPIIFKPRSIFTRGYFMVKNEDLDKLKKYKYFKYFQLYSTASDMASNYKEYEVTNYLDKNTHEVKSYVNKRDVSVSYVGDIYTVNFKRMWEENFNDLSFSHFKWKFYKGELEGFEISNNLLPEYLLTIVTKNKSFEEIISLLEKIMNQLIIEFSRPNIDKSQIRIEDIAHIFENIDCIDLNSNEAFIASENFIKFINEYQLMNNFSTQYVFKFNSVTNKYSISSINLLKKRINKLIYDVKFRFSNVRKANKKTFLLTLKDGNRIEKTKEILIAQILEMFRLASYQVVSGERPEYFVRINSITQIEKILNNEFYESEMVRLVKYRHQQSIKIMTRFFTELTSDKERWDYVEKYFAGIQDYE